MARPWYADGVRFGCTESGACCHSRGEYDYVYFTRDEESRVAEHMGLTLRELRTDYTTRADGLRVARSAGGACVFLDGCRCPIYPVRPVPCRTWPFWPETMTRRAFRTEVASFCAGVGRGRMHSLAEIEQAMREKAHHDHELENEP
jgi:Fe-S-cluster containining protein